MRYEEFTIEGRNAVIEAYRAGRPIDKLFILDGCQDGPILTIKREAKAKQTPVKFVTKERLDQLSETRAHQGVIAQVAAYDYSTVEDILKKAENADIFTGGTENLVEYEGKKVSKASILALAKLAGLKLAE